MTSSILVSTRVKAPPERAFEAFSEEIGTWWRSSDRFQLWPPSSGIITLEPKKGGRFIETLPNGKQFDLGRVIAWNPPKRIRLSWREPGFAPEQSSEVEVKFEQVGAEPRVTVEHFGWDDIHEKGAVSISALLRRRGELWRALLGMYQRLFR